MVLLRRTKFPRCLTADAPNFDRGHSLLPTVVPADSRALSCPPIGALPRNRLAASATGGAAAISPLHPPPAALGSLPTSARLQALLVTFRRGRCLHRPAWICTAPLVTCHCEPVTAVTGSQSVPVKNASLYKGSCHGKAVTEGPITAHLVPLPTVWYFLPSAAESTQRTPPKPMIQVACW